MPTHHLTGWFNPSRRPCAASAKGFLPVPTRKNSTSTTTAAAAARAWLHSESLFSKPPVLTIGGIFVLNYTAWCLDETGRSIFFCTTVRCKVAMLHVSEVRVY